tara:strand:- start:264 stop:518 length:255 start_codon:yes stop_codon:yes gene_type:complete
MIHKLDFSRLLHTKTGVNIVSAILGLGLATLFRKACSGKNCLIFKGPPIDELHNSVYKYNNACWEFMEEPVKCDKNKKTIDLNE